LALINFFNRRGCRTELEGYAVRLYYKISNGKQRYFIKKNKHVAEKVYTYN